MTVPRALDEPLTDAELDELEAFLASDAVPQDCMDLEMLDGFLTAIASGPEQIQPSEWLLHVWSEGGKSSTPAFTGSEQAQRIMALMLRHMVGIERTLAESPTRFKPLLYVPEAPAKQPERTPPEGTAWCEGYMSGVKLRDFGAGFKAYRREVLEGVRLYGDMHRFVPAICARLGASICEVPIKNVRRPHGKSN